MRKILFITAVLFNFTLAAHATPDASTDTKVDPKAALKIQMHQMAANLQELLIYSSSETLFESKNESKKIESLMDSLKNTSHNMKANLPKTGDQDPTLQYVATMFQSEVSRAGVAFKNGNKTYARSVVRTLSQNCVACHSRMDTGNKFNFTASSELVSKLSDSETLRYLAATRSIEPALALAEKIAKDPKILKEKPTVWENAMRTGLALSLRVQSSPKAAVKLVNAGLTNPSLTESEKGLLNSWKKDLESASIQKFYATKNPSKKQISDLRKSAEAQKEFFTDPKSDVNLFTLTRALHQTLSKTPTLKQDPKDLLWLGEAYESLRDLNLWGLHDWYYLACVDRAMGTDLAKQCFGRYEASVKMGYTGTGGEFMPEDLRENVKKLKDRVNAPAPGRQ